MQYKTIAYKATGKKGDYIVNIDGIEVGIVSKSESASRTFWDFEIKKGVKSAKGTDRPIDFGWRRWDNTRNGAVTEYFGGAIYEGRSIETEPNQMVILKTNAVLQSTQKPLNGEFAELITPTTVKIDGEIIEVSPDEYSKLVYYRDADGNTSPSEVYKESEKRYLIETFDFRKIWVMKTSCEIQVKEDCYI